jgi:quercetin dioxygenase-like cupin family protein
MIQKKLLELGILKGAILDFPVIGDTLPMHWHKPESTHITIIARGSFKATGPNWERTVSAGDVIDWEAYQQHQFVALEPSSRIVNIVKGTGTTQDEYGELPVL